jgi:hypothetical protein
MNKNKERVNVFLSGGGVKTSYQPIFLKLLETNYEINNIIGLSFGSLCGYMCIRDLHSEIIEFCKNLTPDSLVPQFKYYNIMKKISNFIKKIPFIGLFLGNIIDSVIKLCCIISGIENKGLFMPKFGEDFFDQINKKYVITDEIKLKLHTFWCIVYNVTRNKIEVINGSHLLIEKYIIASCSRWLIFPPIKIKKLISECICTYECDCHKFLPYFFYNSNDFCTCSNINHRYNEYIDLGFNRVIPYGEDLYYDHQKFNDIINDSNFDIICISFDIKNIINDKYDFTTGDNLFEYLDNLISMTSDIQQKNIVKDIIDSKRKTFIINYDSPIKKSSDINSELIIKIINDGYQLYELFNLTKTLLPNQNNQIQPDLHLVEM